MILDQDEVKKRILIAQGLTDKPLFHAGERGSCAAVEHLSYVQVDTISVVERAHHHAIWSRVPNYKNDFLNTLVKKRRLFEYWSHAAAYLPMSDYRYSLPRKKRHINGEVNWFKVTPEHTKQRKIILDRIKSEGPLLSKDFEKPKNHKAEWFKHTVTKQMLEKLYMEGLLMISERKGFQKVYDLTDNVLPSNIDTSFPTNQEMAEYLIRSYLRSQVLATAKEIGYLRTTHQKNDIKTALKNMIASGEVLPVNIQNNKNNYFALANVIQKPAPKLYSNSEVKIISPFDPLVIQRNRLQDIFNFKYQIECYVPETKRQYGYFALPLLYKNNFVGVVDIKAHRQEKLLEVISIYTNKSVQKSKDFKQSLNISLQKFAEFNHCKTIKGVKIISIY